MNIVLTILLMLASGFFGAWLENRFGQAKMRKLRLDIERYRNENQEDLKNLSVIIAQEYVRQSKVPPGVDTL